jgi:UDP-N-acetylmuramate dehydrogenase
MNAGAHGGEMADHLVEVDLVRLRTGTRETWPVATLGLATDTASCPTTPWWSRPRSGCRPATRRRARGDLVDPRWRREHQPLNDPNCGSVFTNPPGTPPGD